MKLNHNRKAFRITAYVMMAVILIMLTAMLVPSTCFGDSWWYVNCMHSFTGVNGEFSLSNYPETYRGCLMPLFLFFVQSFLGVFGIPTIYGITLCGLLTLVLSLTFIVRVIFPDKNYVIAVFGVSLLFFIFFKDLIVYALSDLYALEAACVGISGIYLTGKLLDDKKRFTAAGIALFSGACLYFAYNTRTIYSFTLILGILLFIFLNFRHKAWCAVCLAFIVLGVVVIGLPQMIINQIHFGNLSLALNTTFGGYDSLFLFQLDAGLGMQRYDTFVGDGISGIVFADSAGILLQQQFAAMGNPSYLNYIMLFFANPLQMLGVFVRHFLNMISIYSNEVFIHSFSNAAAMLTLGFFVQYLVACSLVMGIRNKQYTFKTFLSKKMLYVYTIVFAGLIIIPGAVEGRFALPLYIVAFIYLVCVCSWKQLFADFKKHWLMYCASYLVVYLLFCSFWSTTLASSAMPIML